MKYGNLDPQFSKEAPHLYRATALDNGNIVAANTFELRLNELRGTRTAATHRRTVNSPEKRNLPAIHNVRPEIPEIRGV